MTLSVIQSAKVIVELMSKQSDLSKQNNGVIILYSIVRGKKEKSLYIKLDRYFIFLFSLYILFTPVKPHIINIHSFSLYHTHTKMNKNFEPFSPCNKLEFFDAPLYPSTPLFQPDTGKTFKK